MSERQGGGWIPLWIRDWFRSLVGWVRAIVYQFFSLVIDWTPSSDEWAGAVERAEEQGCVVHVLRRVHLFDALCVHRFCQRHGRRDIGYVYGLEGWLFRPLRWLYRFMMSHPRGVADHAHLAQVLDESRSAILSLRRSPGPLSPRGEEIGTEVIGWLRLYSARTGKKVLLLPHTFIWGYTPPESRHGTMDRLFGSQESPGLLRTMIQFVRRRDQLRVSACEPIVLGDDGLSDAEIRDMLASRLDGERRTMTGPPARSPLYVEDVVLTEPTFARTIDEIEGETDRTREELIDDARREVRKLMARPFPPAVELMDKVFKRVWPALYDGIEVDPEEVEAVKKAAAKGPILLLPTHRSHIDYLLLSWVFHYYMSLPIPYIAAGRNLSFWPLGTVFGGCNAFFIPRTLVDQPVERAVLRSYAHFLLSEGHHVELFLEGTRSRSGKMLPMRTGLLEMLLEQARTIGPERVSLLPTAICYERVIEERHYAGEQMGGSKQPEGLGGLLKTPDVLASAYGRLVVHFGEPLSLAELEAGDEESGSSRSVRRIAYRMGWEMDRLGSLTPTGLVATALLQGPGLGMSERELFESVLFYLRVMSVSGKPLSSALLPCQNLEECDIGNEESPAFSHFKEVIYQAIHLLAEDDLVRIGGRSGNGVYTVPRNVRLRLEFYRNGAIGSIVAPGIVCRVLRETGLETEMDLERVRDESMFLSQLLRYEFVFDARYGFEENFSRSLQLLEHFGIVEMQNDRIRCLEAKEAERLAATIEPALETYRTVGLAIAELRHRARVFDVEIQLRAFALHDRMLLSGDARFPEARNRTAVKLALKAFVTMGALTTPSPKSYAFPDVVGRYGRLEDVIGRIRP